jgi:hypothetical protein
MRFNLGVCGRIFGWYREKNGKLYRVRRDLEGWILWELNCEEVVGIGDMPKWKLTFLKW